LTKWSLRNLKNLAMFQCNALADHQRVSLQGPALNL
jgi:hypothetical protein